MDAIRVATQAELHAALAKPRKPTDWIECVGSGEFTASDSATVWASDSATVRASDSATVRASDSATVRASGSATVRASKHVAVTRHVTAYGEPTVIGGVLIDIPIPRTAEEWCDLYGVEVTDGVAILFKAVDDDWSTSYSRKAGIAYTPGSSPEAPDWDGGVRECGGGLHFVAHPHEGLEFNERATRFVACPVALADIAVHADATMPSKVKARRGIGGVVRMHADRRDAAARAEGGSNDYPTGMKTDVSGEYP